MSGPELLDIGTGRRSWFSRRVRWALLAVTVVLVVVAAVVDARLRDREELAVARCADGVSAAVDRAGRRIDAMYGYVRPVLDNGPGAALKDGLYLLVAEAAEGAGQSLVAARRACTEVSILALHDGLEERRDRCLSVLDAQQARLADVASDGETLLQWMAAPRSC